MSKDYDVKFGTRLLSSVADLVIEDIDVAPVQLNPIARQRAVGYGADFVRITGGTRTVTITFAILNQNIDKRQTALSSLRSWAQVGEEKTLQLPMFEGRHLECACTALPDASYRKWYEGKLKIVFTCYNNPFWTSNELIEVPCGTSFSVGGNVPPLMTIERSGSKLTNQTYASKTEAMTFSTIPSGAMVIDLNRQTAAIKNTSFMKYYDPLSTWIVPKVGAGQIITGVGTVKYRERFM